MIASAISFSPAAQMDFQYQQKHKNE